MSLLSELKQRGLIRVASVYAVASWIIMQVIDVMAPALNMPDWVDGFFAISLLVGFPIAMILAWAFEMTPEGIKRTDDLSADEILDAHRVTALDYLMLAGLALIGSLLLWQQINRGSGTANTSSPTVLGASIAVLPFADLSPEGDQQYFADGISEELLNVLAGVKSLKVAGRTSSFSFRGSDLDLREIGRLLGVANILEGSVRKQGNRVRITAQLVKVDDGFHLWSETYDREMTDVFAVQDEISAEVLVAFTALLAGDDVVARQPVLRTNVDAYGLYLKAKQLVYQRSLGSIQEAQALLDEALESAPEYAPAYAIRSVTELLLSDAAGSYGRTPSAKALPIAKEFAQRALELDSELADAHAALGLVYLHQKDAERAVLSLNRAIELNPNHIDARNWLAMSLATSNRFRDVAEANLELFELDPLYRPGATNVVNQLLFIGDRARAQVVLSRLQEHNEQSLYNWSYSTFLADEGRIAKSVTTGLSVFKDYSDTNRGGVLAARLLNIGDLDGARKFNIARLEIYALLVEGQMDSAITAARRILESSPDYYSAQTDYIIALALAGRHADLVNYFRTTYVDAATFEKQLYDARSTTPPFAELAYALRVAGDQAEFDAVVTRWRNSININRAGGADNAHWDLEDAQWSALAGKQEDAIEWISKSADRTNGLLGIIDFELTFLTSLLKSDVALAGLLKRNRERINQERNLLGLGPLAETPQRSEFVQQTP